MDEALEVAVVTPEGAAHQGPATQVVVPAHDGEVAFLRGHAPFVGALGMGEMRIEDPHGPTVHLYVEGGVVQVRDDEVVVLAERVRPTHLVDLDQARQDLAEALLRVPTTEEAFEARDRALESARARLRVVARRS